MCTGETSSKEQDDGGNRVYPHVYGGNGFWQAFYSTPEGLSPCVRGKLIVPGTNPNHGRSIPMCTGETQLTQFQVFQFQVYPHVYGGNVNRSTTVVTVLGLSPCVRGKPFAFDPAAAGSGSIPMCTGETSYTMATEYLEGVYPHVYGGNDPTGRAHKVKNGLSPCVRGKPSPGRWARASPGSIPMCTGETWWQCHPMGMTEVYPHVYGGNFGCVFRQPIVGGLSPCVRGKLPRTPGTARY